MRPNYIAVFFLAPTTVKQRYALPNDSTVA